MRRIFWSWLILFFFFSLSLFLALSTGPVRISLFALSPRDQAILLHLRLPRALSSFFVGGGLALSGAVFQGLFRNPLADSYLLGISSGASLGAAAALVLGFTSPLAIFTGVSFFSFLGSLLALFLVFYFGSRDGYFSVFRLLLSGLGVGLFFSSFVAVLMIMAEEELKALIFFFMGGFSSASWETTWVAVTLVPVCVWIAFYYARELNVLLLGEETALSSGVNTKRVQAIYAVLAAFLTSISVSVAGLIGFVGLIVPHMVRMVFGADHRILLPVTFLLGGTFLILCDTLAKVVLAPSELPVGVVTSLFGVPVFLYLLKKERGEYGL
ncbi:MAG: iron ABC transporter permease [Deltaproteobacteria bacterium]|nr:iron ABC transporter permease [Deltaproteobacteria bacterium]